MCAGAEMDSRFTALYATAHRDSRRTQPTFSLALAAFDDAHWSALSPARPLRRWHLVELTDGAALTVSPLRIPERVLHYLAGVLCLDDRLDGVIKPVSAPAQLAPSLLATAEAIAARWSRAKAGLSMPVVQLTGFDLAGKRAVAAAACGLLGLHLHSVAAWRLPSSPAEIETFRRLWDRESVLSSSALLLELDDAESPESISTSAMTGLVESLFSPLFVSTTGSRKCADRDVVLYDVANPTETEQTELWHSALRSSFRDLSGRLEPLVSQFNLSAAAIHSAAQQAVNRFEFDAASHAVRPEDPGNLTEYLWDACRASATAPRRPCPANRACRGLGRPGSPRELQADPATDRGSCQAKNQGLQGVGLRVQRRAGARDQRAVRRRQRHGQDHGGRGAGDRSSGLISTAST